MLTFVSVILGLAVSDLAISLHRLLGARRRVNWDALPLLAGLLAFVKIVTQWWSWFSVAPFARGVTLWMFLALLVGTVLLFLLAAAALPDEIGEGPVDLKAHYAAVSRRFWLLFAAQTFLMTGVGVWAQMQIVHGRFALGSLVTPTSGVFLLSVVLAFVRIRWLHAVSLVGITLLYLSEYAGHPLAS
ncbi:MAG: hypothetical protein JSS35_10815 [Proteobacteria bacterium]|nr:hypothetical protein [Pseudomonadota bacterium]